MASKFDLKNEEKELKCKLNFELGRDCSLVEVLSPY